MEFLENSRLVSFLYNETPFEECGFRQEVFEEKNIKTTVYTHPDGLKVTNILRKLDTYGAYEWVNWFENTGDKPTGILSRIWDGDFAFPLEKEEPRPGAYLPDPQQSVRIFSPRGSDWSADEFSCDPDLLVGERYPTILYPGEAREYKPSGGRSSSGAHAPFFNIYQKGRGVIVALGWTGQWLCRVLREGEHVTVNTGIENTSFRLLPKEKIRTSSTVVLFYEGTPVHAQNLWRRLIKNEYSVMGKSERPAQGPFCLVLWGGMTTASMIDRIRKVGANDLPFEYIWMDAGWYGDDTAPSPDEFEGNWYSCTGNWQVNSTYHPDGLKDVAKEIQTVNRKFLMWFEPERAIRGTPVTVEHPEYFLEHPTAQTRNLLLNLGNPEAWEYCFELVSQKIELFQISCYRQDFNMAPLAYWNGNDGEDRKGITEIKYIMGLYRLWDSLLERFPHLLIDNCASGGRRIDMETLRRSIPLWRSDAQCPANFPPEFSQAHTLSFSSWIPYSGTGTGRQIGDVYRFRSSYSPAMTTNFALSEKEPFGERQEDLDWIKKYGEEYLRARPYFSGDFYPLTKSSSAQDVWSAAQFELPERQSGIVQVFRRPQAPYAEAAFALGGLQEGRIYTFTDADDGTTFEVSVQTLQKTGFVVRIPEKRCAKLYFYSYKATV